MGDSSRIYGFADTGSLSRGNGAAAPAAAPPGPAAPAAAQSGFVHAAAKLGGDLARLALGIDQAPRDASSIPGLSLAAPDFTIVNGMVAVDMSSMDGNIKGLLHQLEALGLQHGSTYGNTVSGLLPIGALIDASNLANLNQARAAMAYGNVGEVTSQGDKSMNADDARTKFGLDGTGFKIAVLSDSYNNLGGEAAGIASKDLPSDVLVLQDLASGGTDEGRGMLELVHDVAPGADLMFRTAFIGAADFANGIQQLVNAGADVIVDDIGYSSQPFFQDGIIAQSADIAVERGVPYFTSAGNSGDNSYQAKFVDSGKTISYTNGNGVAISNAVLHDFDTSAGVDTLQSFTFAGTAATGGATNRFRIAFQWDEPFSSVSTANGGAKSDYDLLLLDNNGAIVSGLTASTSKIGGDAFEFFDITYSGSAPLQLNLGIARAEGSTANLLKTIVVRSTGFTLNEFDTKSSTAMGHANAQLAQSVGAADFEDTPAFGTNPPVIEDFSSLGGTPILFDTTGKRLTTPEIRNTVDITAPDGTDTTFFGSDTGDAGSFPNFFGTSAAAPHAAAVAALLLQRNPNATPEDIFNALASTAIDMGTKGYDRLTGAGLIDANAAVAALNLNDTLIGTNAANTLKGLAGNDTLFGKAGIDTLDGGTGSDTLVGGDDSDIYYVNGNGDVVVETATSGNNDLVLASASYTLQSNVFVERLRTTSAAGTKAINLTGNTLTQEITGNAGNNIINDGGTGKADVLIGLGGDDTYRVFNAGDTIKETSSQGTNDKVQAAVSYTLGAGVHVETFTTIDSTATTALTLNGNELKQTITGNAGANTLRGFDGDDTINGGAGNDKISGGLGNDTLAGNSGADTYYFTYALNGTTNVDTIKGFSSIDLISLSASIFTKAGPAGTLAAGAFVANTSGAAADASDRIIYETDTGILRYDPDGTGAAAAVKFAVMDGLPAMNNADFVIA